jgi:Ser/Thr protein kinase RdoA (MazF antagonist)
MEDPVLLHRIYKKLAGQAAARKYPETLRTARYWLERLRKDFADEAYAALPHTVTHGDYTPANLLFHHDAIAGVFDFDWSRWAPRIRDLADGLFFISGNRRTPLEPGNIWSLTEAVELTVDRAALWLNAYHDVSPIREDERAAIPLALAARWLSVRVEGTAKVPETEQIRFALANLAAPLEWLEQHWHEVLAKLAPPPYDSGQ